MTLHQHARTAFACIAALGLVATTTAAAPATDTSPDDGTHTVIHVDTPAPELLLGVNVPLEAGRAGDDPTTTVLHTRAPEPAIVPPVGETITVVYTDATTTYTTPYSLCTHSSSAGNPHVVSNRARAAITVSTSTGCSGNAHASASLQWSHLGWNERGHFSWPALRPGNSVSATVTARNTCGSGAGTWRSVAFFGTSSSGHGTSPAVSLNCRG